jgi:methylmalonyl-CoA mutase cobalamin-binding subunit
VLACEPLDSHNMALETFQVMLSHAQFNCVNLGPQVNQATLATAARTSSAQAVVVVSHLGRNRAAAVSALRAVEHSVTALFYAGAAFRTQATRQGLPGLYLGGNLSEGVARVSTRLRNTS